MGSHSVALFDMMRHDGGEPNTEAGPGNWSERNYYSVNSTGVPGLEGTRPTERLLQRVEKRPAAHG